MIVANVFYSISAQTLKKRNDYYKILGRTQKGDTDITDWLCWFLQTLEQALISTQTTTDEIIHKVSFWQTQRQRALNTRQVTMLNILLTDFYGKLTTKKWAVMTKCSIDPVYFKWSINGFEGQNNWFPWGISKI